MDGMLARMSHQQLVKWIAYATLEPFGEERADFRMARLAALTANIHRDQEKTSTFSEKDFMPEFGREPESAEDVARNVESYFAMLAAAGTLPDQDEPGETK